MRKSIHGVVLAVECLVFSVCTVRPFFTHPSAGSIGKYNLGDTVEVKFKFAEGQEKLLGMIGRSYLFYQPSLAGHFPERKFLMHEATSFVPNVWYSYSVPKPISRLRLDFHFKTARTPSSGNLVFSDLRIDGWSVKEWELERPWYEDSVNVYYLYPSEKSMYGRWRLYGIVVLIVWILCWGALAYVLHRRAHDMKRTALPQ